MTEDPLFPGLQLDDLMQSRRLHWRVERVGWAAMAILVICAMLGLAGGWGPFNRREAAWPELSVAVQDQPIMRSMVTTRVTIRIGAGKEDSDTCKLWFSRNHADAITIESFVPEPVTSESDIDGFTYTFRTSAPDQTVIVHARIKPERLGLVRASIGIDSHRTRPITYFVLP